MRPDLPSWWLSGLTVVLLVLGACTARFSAEPPSPTGGGTGSLGGGTGGGDGLPEDAGFARSARANLRFKGPERLSAELAKALELPEAALCNELGRFPCTTLVHTLALGGVDPYNAGIYETPTATSVSTPLVVDRLVLSACAARVVEDAKDLSKAVIYRDVQVTPAGALADPGSPQVQAAVRTLFRRAHLRDPEASESEALVALARDIAARSPSTGAVDWALSACFVVFSSNEFLFY